MDTVSRQAAIDAIDKIFPVNPMRNDYTQGIACGAALAKEYIKQIPAAPPELHADDCISRQAAIDALKNRWKKTRNYEGNGDDIAEECELYLKQVPSAQPESERTVI